jgi:hypothetical protein
MRTRTVVKSIVVDSTTQLTRRFLFIARSLGKQEIAMPQQTIPTGQDWTTQNAGRGDGLKSSSIPKSGRELDSLKAKGLITTEKRYV